MFKHLLVATDGSELGNKALDAALTIAKAHGSKLTVLTSTDPIGTGLGAGGMGTIDTGTIWASLEEAHAEEARKVLDAARQKAARADVDINAIHRRSSTLPRVSSQRQKNLAATRSSWVRMGGVAWSG